MREMQNQWSLLRPCHLRLLPKGANSESDPRSEGGEGEHHLENWNNSQYQKQNSKQRITRKQPTATHLFLRPPLNKCAPKLWHRGESRWSPFHRIPCGNFRGLFPNPFKWTFHLSASSSVSAIPTVQPFLHHFLHKLAWSQGRKQTPVRNMVSTNEEEGAHTEAWEGRILEIQYSTTAHNAKYVFS